MEEGDQISPDQEIDFCTLGMFIIGETAFTLESTRAMYTHAIDILVQVLALMDACTSLVGV